MSIELIDNRPTPPFHSWLRNVHSQHGEDGIIERLWGLSGAERRYFVEFGAWDGRHLSNCAKLADEGWSGCFIEADAERFGDLSRNYGARPQVKPVHALVGTRGVDALSEILSRVGAPKDLGVLSIDIDGNDHHVWAALEGYDPTLCVIEFNPTVPAGVAFVQPEDANLHQGCSLTALCQLARTKGYELVACTVLNAFFMPQALCRARSIPTYRAEDIKDRRFEAYIFHGYDGTMMTAGCRELVWHGVSYGTTELQILPAELRQFPASPAGAYHEALGRFRSQRSNRT